MLKLFFTHLASFQNMLIFNWIPAKAFKGFGILGNMQQRELGDAKVAKKRLCCS